MRKITCERCAAQLPINEAFSVFERRLCPTCADIELTQRSNQGLRTDAVTRLIDPTICVTCGADGGNVEWPQLAEVPLCATCENYLRHRPYPQWLKLCAVAVVGVIVLTFVHNERFYRAYVESRLAMRAFAHEDYHAAFIRMDSASKRVPEEEELRLSASFLHAVDLLTDGKSAEALPLLLTCKDRMGTSPLADDLMLEAEIGAAFDRKDYDTFLQKQQAKQQRHPDKSIGMVAVASAYACKYAVTGDPQYKDQALHWLDEAARMPDASKASVNEYTQRVQHRLHTRQILTVAEYKRQFPGGWQPEAQK